MEVKLEPQESEDIEVLEEVTQHQQQENSGIVRILHRFSI